jgi:hypothetical protein
MNTAGINNYNILHKYLVRELNIIFDKLDNDNFTNSIVKSYEPLSTMIERNEETIYLYQIIEDLDKTYYFSEYYDLLVEYNINTPYSIITDLYTLYNNSNKINEYINQLQNNHCFARLDTCSSKPESPFNNHNEIITSLSSSSRTNIYLHNLEHKLILRTYIENIEKDYYSARCFIHNQSLRGISGPYFVDNIPEKKLKYEIELFVKKIIEATEYNCCTIDILVPKTYKNDFIVIEINSPTWLFATSGIFDLSIPYDISLLFEDKIEYIEYPEMRVTNKYDQITIL